MSAYAEAAQAIRKRIEYALADAGSPERVRPVPEDLPAALEEAAALRIPPEAQRRLRDAAAALGAAEDRRAALGDAATRLAPLLDATYPSRALAQPVTRLPGVGPRSAEALKRRQIRSIEDLLFFLPRSYDDRRHLQPIAALQVGRPAVFAGEVVRAGSVQLRNGRRFFEAVISDGTAAVGLKWFRGAARLADRVRPGVRLLVAGDVRRYRYAKEIHHPDIETLGEDESEGDLPRIVPVYPNVEGIPPRTLRRILSTAVDQTADLVESWLPADFARRRALPELGEAVRQVHQPETFHDPQELRERRTSHHLRLVAEELLLLQVGLELRRSARARDRGQALAVRDALVERARARLPFELTADQARVWEEIATDLARNRPMNRLVIGDVGTGKTVLAWLAAVAAHASNLLTAVLAPTEVLAEQHHATFRRFAESAGLRVALLTGSTPAPERKSTQRLLRLGEIAVIVGTHALLSEAVALPRLGLTVIDEQQRFGVAQRRALADKGRNPHVLGMTATPIPRSLALTVFGDLDHSLLRERPPGRAPVDTRVIAPDDAREAWDELRRTLQRGEQVYVVYPVIDESEKQDLKDATRGFERMRKALPGVEVALLHGRLDAAQRSSVMGRFAAGEVRVLVSTSVIEVGVDVPEATLLVVQHADRFGLSQLHQLRGRVGRGGRPGRALLLADPSTEEAAQRLAVLEASASGFDIAEEDMRLRGPGQWLGTQQSGHLPELRLADLVRHGELLELAREAAVGLVAHDPGLARQSGLRAAVERRWGDRLDFGQVA